MLRDALLAAGVAPEAVDVVIDEQEAIDHALASAEENDLVLIFGDEISRSWKQIIYFGQASGDGERDPAAPPIAEAPPPMMAAPAASVASDAATASARPVKGPVTRRAAEPETVELPDGQRLVRDDRGVRVVHDEEAD